MEEKELELYVRQLEDENIRLKHSNKALRTNNKGLLTGMNKLNKRMTRYVAERKNGTLVRFPCATGTTIYRIAKDQIVEDCVVRWEVYDANTIKGICEKTLPFDADCFNETVFLHYKEALRAKNMKG